MSCILSLCQSEKAHASQQENELVHFPRECAIIKVAVVSVGLASRGTCDARPWTDLITSIFFFMPSKRRMCLKWDAWYEYKIPAFHRNHSHLPLKRKKGSGIRLTSGSKLLLCVSSGKKVDRWGALDERRWLQNPSVTARWIYFRSHPEEEAGKSGSREEESQGLGSKRGVFERRWHWRRTTQHRHWTSANLLIHAICLKGNASDQRDLLLLL